MVLVVQIRQMIPLRRPCEIARLGAWRGRGAHRVSGADGLATLAAPLAVLESARLKATVAPQA